MTNVVYLQNEQQAALDHARHLADSGVPLFVAKPYLDEQSMWVPDHGTGYVFPKGWQRSVADRAVVDRWRQGDALCAVMGHVTDGADFDPQHGGERSLEHLKQNGLLPRVYGIQSTPSGGWHYLLASLKVRSRDGLLPGLDYKAGTPEGGRGFLFLAPTVKLSKTTGELAAYSWETAPDLSVLALVGADETGAGMRALLAERTATEYAGPTYVGRRYRELSEAERAWADADVAGVVEYWRDLLHEAETWPEGRRDERGRGWEGLARDWAWVCARLAVTPWVGLETDDAEKLYETELPWDVTPGKWDAGLLARASTRPVEPPPWDGLGTLRVQERVDVTNAAVAAEWLRNELGVGPLSGFFRRGDRVVHTPRIDEDGYVALSTGDRDLDGPAQVRTAGLEVVRARVQFSYSVVHHVATRKRLEGCTFPNDAVALVLGDTTMAPNLRLLRGVTHTPMLRADGSVLDTVGYDEQSRRLYLPEPGLIVGAIPKRPTKAEVATARGLILEMLADFPWNTMHDRANYLALLLTPLLRELVSPPYKMGVLNAHQPGSGKSLLAWVLRTLHGGVLRGDVPKDGEEFRKQITAVLSSTTAPVVQFDNVRHLEATQLDAVLTSDTWSDRVLGASQDVTSRNDRLWTATGNNVTLGGDLVRRVLWVSIDPRLPHPEARTDFAIGDLKAWVRERRGELLRALLVMVRAWVVAGRPLGEKVGSDDFATWIETCRGVLAVAGVDGVVEDRGTIVQATTEEGDETVGFYTAVLEQFGTETWTAGQVAEMGLEDAPEGMNQASSRSVGRWLTRNQGRWAGELCIRQNGVSENGHSKLWKVERYGLG